jgi:hypothetical protein
MPIEISRSFGDGNTVPYGPIFDAVRKYHGFTDLRGKPDLVGKIFECASSQALTELLVLIAREQSYFSLGCDLGRHSEEEKAKTSRRVSGGYIQVASINYARTSTAQYDAFCDVFSKELGQRATKGQWKIDLQGTFVQFNIPCEPSARAPSIWIWFFAAAKTHKEADASREELLGAIGESLHAHRVRQSLIPRS